MNFTGAWIDRVNEMNPAKTQPKRQIVWVKGVGIAGLNSEGDAIMCVPSGQLHYIGPTETVYEGDINDVTPEDEDIDELIHEINLFMPGMNMDRYKILQAWAGFSPLNYDPDLPKGRRLRYSVIDDLGKEGFPNMLTVTWVAFMMRQPTARRVLKAVRKHLRPSLPQQALRFGGEDEFATSSPSLLAARPDVTHAHILRSVEKEYARDLVGILYRRTGLGWYTQIPEKAAREAAEIVAPTLGWDKNDIDREVESFAAYVRKYHLMSSTDWTA